MLSFKLENISKSFNKGKEKFFALRNISLSLPSKGMVFISGKSGSGKSTLLNILMGIVKPDEVPDRLNPNSFQYKTVRVKIVGIVENEKNIVYHNHDWTISFFRDELGVSSFDLCVNALVIELDDNVDASKLISKFEKSYMDYTFISPLDEISKSIDNTLDFIKLIVILFSVLAGTISILLLVTLILLNILENQHEVKIMKYSGITNNDISSQFVVDALVQTFIAYLISLLELVVIDYVTGKAINDMLGSSSKSNVNVIPFVLTFIIAMSLAYLIAKIIVLFKNRDIRKEITRQK